MIVVGYLEQPPRIPMEFICDHASGRRFALCEEMIVTLSDGSLLRIEKGFETDLSSVPGWAWSIFKPIDAGFIGDLIHDKLWTDKENQLSRFGWEIYPARKFADDERHRWRTALCPEKKIKNAITHRIIRWVGGFFYSRQLAIPH